MDDLLPIIVLVSVGLLFNLVLEGSLISLLLRGPGERPSGRGQGRIHRGVGRLLRALLEQRPPGPGIPRRAAGRPRPIVSRPSRLGPADEAAGS